MRIGRSKLIIICVTQNRRKTYNLLAIIFEYDTSVSRLNCVIGINCQVAICSNFSLELIIFVYDCC